MYIVDILLWNIFIISYFVVSFILFYLSSHHDSSLQYFCMEQSFYSTHEIFVVWAKKKKKRKKRAGLLKAVFDAIVSMVSIRLKLDNE